METFIFLPQNYSNYPTLKTQLKFSLKLYLYQLFSFISNKKYIRVCNKVYSIQFDD